MSYMSEKIFFNSSRLNRQGDLKVIRPFAYIRETDTRHFAEEFDLPVIPENWPACFTAAKVIIFTKRK